MENSNINIQISPMGNEGAKDPFYARIGKAIVGTIAKAKWKSILKVYFVTFFFLATAVALVFAYTASKDQEVVRMTAHSLAAEQQDENIRDFVVTPKIQRDMEIMVYSLNADRAFIFELHNGKKNVSGLPFRFADMTYEEVNRERKIDKVAMKYQDVPLTLYRYPEYLHKEKIFIGTIDEIEQVDYDFAQCIREDGGVYLGMIYMNIDGQPLGFLGVSFHDMNNVPDDNVIETKLTENARIISELLDLQTQINL
jgi:hypothetical protein